jgi:hypothetical protein
MSGAPSQFQISYVEAALIALLRSVMPGAYGTPEAPVRVDVDSIGDRDFNAQGQLALRAPAQRVRFGGAEYNNLRDNQRLTYEAALPFEVMCFESSLRGKANERLQTLVLVETTLNQLAGARLALADGSSTMPLEIKSVSPVITEDGPVDQLFAITVLVKGIAQFNGPNARFGS